MSSALSPLRVVVTGLWLALAVACDASGTRREAAQPLVLSQVALHVQDTRALGRDLATVSFAAQP